MTQISNCEQLFILELLIENLKILNRDPTSKDSNIPYNFSIKFGCLSCFDISVGDSEIKESEEDGETYKWNTGKSCLFSMQPILLANTISSTPLLLVLYKKKTYLPAQSTIGTAQVPMGAEFLKIAQDATSWLSESPASATTQDRFEIVNSDGNIVAMVDLSLRLTCQGTCILTNIQISDDHKFRFEKYTRPAEPKCKACTDGKVLKSAVEYNDESLSYQKYDEKISVSHTLSQKSSSDTSGDLRVIEKPKKQIATGPKLKPAMKKNHDTYKIRKERQQFYPGPEVIHRGVILGHLHCKNSTRAVPAKHGWAWATATTPGIKQSYLGGWKPGYFHRSYLKNKSLQLVIKKELKNRSNKCTIKKIGEIEKPNICIRKKSIVYEMEYVAPFRAFTEKRNFPANGDDSDFEINVQLPDPLPDPPKLRHQAQQFCEQDFPKPKSKIVKLHKVQRTDLKDIKIGKKVLSSKKLNQSMKILSSKVRVGEENVKGKSKTKNDKSRISSLPKQNNLKLKTKK